VAVEIGNFERQSAHPLGSERMIWLALYESACQSIQFASAIRFS